MATPVQEAGLVKSHEAPPRLDGRISGPSASPASPSMTPLLSLLWGPWYLHPRHEAHGSALGRHEEGLEVQQLEEVVCLEEGLLGNPEGQVAPPHPSGFDFSLTCGL